MGQELCCYPKIKLPDLQQDMNITDEDLIEQITELRDKYKKDIDQSKVYSEGDAIFRGKKGKDKRKYGYGEFFYKNYFYLGLFENNQPNGRGLAIKSQQEFYRGNFKEGHFHGYGKEYGPNYTFKGQFQEGYRKKGVFKTDQLEYKGSFLNNTFHGEGVISFANGVRYEGLFVDGKMEGKGVVFYPNGKIFKGELANNKCKKGNFEWANEKLMKQTSGIKIEDQINRIPVRPIRLVSKDLTIQTKTNESARMTTQRTASQIVNPSSYRH